MVSRFGPRKNRSVGKRKAFRAFGILVYNNEDAWTVLWTNGYQYIPGLVGGAAVRERFYFK